MNVAKYSESTLTKILNIIDDYSHNKDEELASLLCIGIKEVGYFVIQFNILTLWVVAVITNMSITSIR